MMLRSRLSRVVAAAGGLITVGTIDRALAPPVKPLSTLAAASAIGGVRIYQYDICPFCNKLKALLDFYKLPYETVDVNPLLKREIKFSDGYRKVPIAVFGKGEEAVQVNDSPVIATQLLDRIDAGRVVPSAELACFRSPAAMEWAKWSDEKLAVLLFPNITRSFSEAYQMFGYVFEVPHFSLADKWSNQFVGAFAMWMAQGKIKKKYAINDERAALREALQHWMSEGVGASAFAGGDAPNFADICVFGCLKAIDRTSAYKEIMAETSIAAWYERVGSLVKPGGACTSRQ
eukprot:CAMPEP_0119331834 /NCGR_PEP_ID=MMETSP1333-20130426/81470_1 /TAXON_ID=418940 /ORGANISM="Scyphosphaera apsteinii, Strain RCC1455" /LENGTH=288 /DNA_ID=CAMNT_0007341523 /DNA_START=93 /DNA_END=959 /DNA_ORIENTATION=-